MECVDGVEPSRSFYVEILLWGSYQHKERRRLETFPGLGLGGVKASYCY